MIGDKLHKEGPYVNEHGQMRYRFKSGSGEWKEYYLSTVHENYICLTSVDGLSAIFSRIETASR